MAGAIIHGDSSFQPLNVIPDDRLPETGTPELPIENMFTLRSPPRLVSRARVLSVREPSGKYRAARFVSTPSSISFIYPGSNRFPIHFSRLVQRSDVTNDDTAVGNCISYSKFTSRKLMQETSVKYCASTTCFWCTIVYGWTLFFGDPVTGKVKRNSCKVNSVSSDT